MDIPAAGLDPEATYKLITGIIVPRPIAWVTTLSPGGAVNLAPFSAFTFVSNKPPMVGINVGRKAGRLKDTGVNIHAGGEFVVNIADETLIEPVHLSAIEYAPEVSEADLLGLELKASQAVRVPSLAAAPRPQAPSWRTPRATNRFSFREISKSSTRILRSSAIR